MPNASAALPRHLPYLDSARGIAALMVLFGHYTGWKYNNLPVIQGTNFIFNAADAVSFFFVLSGFVLSYQYLVLGNSLDIRKYYINRFIRLFPAFFITVLINALYWQRHEFTFDKIYHDIILGENDFWKEAVLIRPVTKFFGPGWTLVVELAVSFFIPFLIVLSKANKRLLWWLILSSLLVTRITEMFLFHFTLGVIIAGYYTFLTAPAFKETKWYRFRHLILIVAIVFFSIRRIQEVSPFGPDFYSLGAYFQVNLFQYTGLGAFVFLIFIIRSSVVKRILSHKLLLFFGKISYGIYLMHWLIVCIIYDNWTQVLSYFPGVKSAFVVMMLVCFFTTILLATIIHYAVEMPFIRLGKRFTSKLKPSLIV